MAPVSTQEWDRPHLQWNMRKKHAHVDMHMDFYTRKRVQWNMCMHVWKMCMHAILKRISFSLISFLTLQKIIKETGMENAVDMEYLSIYKQYFVHLVVYVLPVY